MSLSLTTCRTCAEIVAGRGSFVDAFPLFGYKLNDYDALFAEKLDLLLQIRDNESVTWLGKFRAPLNDQPIYPRPVQSSLPVWVGVDGTPQSLARAGTLGLPLMVAVIGGETHRFRCLIDIYRKAGAKVEHAPDRLKVGLHSIGYVGNTTREANDDFYPDYAETFNKAGKERGWPPVTRTNYDAQAGPTGAILVGSPTEVAQKILRHSEALGGISRVTFQMDQAALPQAKLLKSIELIGEQIIPLIRRALTTVSYHLI